MWLQWCVPPDASTVCKLRYHKIIAFGEATVTISKGKRGRELEEEKPKSEYRRNKDDIF